MELLEVKLHPPTAWRVPSEGRAVGRASALGLAVGLQPEGASGASTRGTYAVPCGLRWRLWLMTVSSRVSHE